MKSSSSKNSASTKTPVVSASAQGSAYRLHLLGSWTFALTSPQPSMISLRGSSIPPA